jgi:hypothetical protein
MLACCVQVSCVTDKPGCNLSVMWPICWLEGLVLSLPRNFNMLRMRQPINACVFAAANALVLISLLLNIVAKRDEDNEKINTISSCLMTAFVNGPGWMLLYQALSLLKGLSWWSRQQQSPKNQVNKRMKMLEMSCHPNVTKLLLPPLP